MQQKRYCWIIFFSTFICSTYVAAEYNQSYWIQALEDFNTNQYNSSSFLYDSLPDVGACNEGSLTQAAKLRAFEAVNEVRKLHDLPAVEYSFYYDFQAQQAAFIQLANGFLTHTPPATSNCYSQAAYDGSSSSNLHSSSYTNDPLENIVGWIDDANNVSTLSAVGHRRWMINPFLQYVSYGQTNGPAALKVFNFNQEISDPPVIEVDYVAFPYQKYPYFFFSDLSHGKRTPWSFTVIENKTSIWRNRSSYFSNAQISVANIATGESLAITNVYSDSNGYGVPNIITWSPQDWEYDTWYSVEISNVAMQDGRVQDYVYEVYIDYSGLIDISRPLENGDSIIGTEISGELHDGYDEDTYQLRLHGDTTITGSSQYSNMAFFMTLYDSSKQVVHVADEAFTLYLEDDIYTLLISNCDPSVGCYSGSKQYTVSMTAPLPSANQVLIEAFIERLYLNILNRNADANGLAYWSNVIQLESAAFVARGFFNSPEFTDLGLPDEAFIERLYQTLFDRAADQGGKTYWLNQLNNGILRDMVLYGFLLSPEFTELSEAFSVIGFSQDDETLYLLKQFVVRFYQQVLQREAEINGYDFWVEKLKQGSRTAGDIARSFFFGDEFSSQGHTDSVFINIAYQAILDRNADDAGRNYWLGRLSAGLSRFDLINGFLNSSEFARLADSYGVRVR